MRAGSMLALMVLAGCNTGSKTTVDLMPAPSIFSAGDAYLFVDIDPDELREVTDGVLYATNRMPVSDDENAFGYSLGRGMFVRGGTANVSFSKQEFTWDELTEFSVEHDRRGKFSLEVKSVNEMGALKDTLPPFHTLADVREREGGEEAFLAQVEQLLARTDYKDINIYIHGYNVDFEQPIVVVSQLWHYLGYEGAFMAFCWPSTPKALAYIKDIATAQSSARYLRLLIELLHEKTSAERINLIGYSAGSRVTVAALHELALIYRDQVDPADPASRPLGQVVLISGDIDRNDFSNALYDGALAVAEHITVYNSKTDKALGYARWLFGKRDRLGNAIDPETLTEDAKRRLREKTNLHIIDVTDAENSTIGGGHGYFRSSPWVSSDLLLSLRYHLLPEERGLVEYGDSSIMRFPEDYPLRVRRRLRQLMAHSDEPEHLQLRRLVGSGPPMLEKWEPVFETLPGGHDPGSTDAQSD